MESLPATAADAGHTAWMFVACAMVLLMTPGLAFFYGGLDRRLVGVEGAGVIRQIV